MLVKIAITGPESTGKSTLTQLLAAHYQTVYTTEFARSYIQQLNRPYTPEDVLHIAKMQYQLNEQLPRKITLKKKTETKGENVKRS